MSPETVAYLSRPAPGGCCSRHQSGSSATARYRAGSYSTRSRPRRRTRSRACSLRSSPTCIERRLRESRPCPCPGSQARIGSSRASTHACARPLFGVSLEQALVAVDGPLGNRRAERAAAAAARQAASGGVLAHPQAHGAQLVARASPRAIRRRSAPSALCRAARARRVDRAAGRRAALRHWRQAMPAATPRARPKPACSVAWSQRPCSHLGARDLTNRRTGRSRPPAGAVGAVRHRLR